jgi:hypothetical protein
MKKYLTKSVLTPTLLSLKVGEVIEIKHREFKIAAVRTAVSRINRNGKTGLRLACSEVGIPDGIRVRRVN